MPVFLAVLQMGSLNVVRFQVPTVIYFEPQTPYKVLVAISKMKTQYVDLHLC